VVETDSPRTVSSSTNEELTVTTRPNRDESVDGRSTNEITEEPWPPLDDEELLAVSCLLTARLRADDLPDELLLELLEASWLGALSYIRTVTVPADRVVRDAIEPQSPVPEAS
jgi:hypothetical protein